MALQQSIDLALASEIGGERPCRRRRSTRPCRPSRRRLKRLARGRRDRPPAAAAHAPHAPTTSPPIREAAAVPARATPPTWCSSAPADRASAARPWRSSRTTRFRAPAASPTARAFISSTTSTRSPSTTSCTGCRSSSTRFVAISKSGGTGETLMQTIAVLCALDKAGPAGTARRNVPRPVGAARRRRQERPARSPRARGRALPRAPHRRRRALSRCSPMWASCRPPCSASTSRAIRQGAADAYEPFRAGAAAADVPAALGAALDFAADAGRQGITVTMAYADRLERFTRWWVQLWAESVGKDGKGSQPVAAIGPVDQHSQLQLYLARPERQALHRDHHRRRGPRARHGREACEARRRAGLCRQAHRRPRRRARPRHRRHAGQERPPDPPHAYRASSTSARSASC